MNFFKKVIRSLYRRGRAYERDSYLEKLQNRGLKTGKNLKMLQDVIIDESHCWHISIGNDVTLAPRVHILAHDASTKFYLGYTKIGKVEIGDRVFIGASSIVLPGVVIGNDVIVGAGSVVTKDIPSGNVAVGNPAKIVEKTTHFLEKKRSEMENFPLFGTEYTVSKGVSMQMKEEMNIKMENCFGYIV